MDHNLPKPLQSPPSFRIPDDLEPDYVNLARITHSPAELVFDFARMLPGDPAATVQTRVVMTPLSAKLFYLALAENLARYEANFGEIHVPSPENSLAAQLFRPPAPPKNP